MGTQTFNQEEQYRKVAREWFRNRTPDRISVPQDWADDLIKGAATWVYESEVPTWLLKKIENVPNVFLQLPAPDRRWIIKFRGDLWGPFDQQFGGWQDVHDLFKERTRTLFGVSLEQTGMSGEVTHGSRKRAVAKFAFTFSQFSTNLAVLKLSMRTAGLVIRQPASTRDGRRGGGRTWGASGRAYANLHVCLAQLGAS